MKNKKDLLLIESCVFKSAQIIEMKVAKQAILKAKSLTMSCTPVFPHEACLINLINDIDNKICEYKLHISKILAPLLLTQGLFIDQKYWFSEKEIRQGFSIFYTATIESNKFIILFLRDLLDPITNKLYPMGYLLDGSAIKDTSIREFENNTIPQKVMSLKECLKIWYQ